MNKKFDRAWLAGLGLLACGPLAPATTEGGQTTGDDTTTDTTGQNPTSGTTGETTGPPPECEQQSDCSYCYSCREGTCEPDPLCCDYATPNGVERRSCSPPPYYECLTDDECGIGYVCEFGECVPLPVPPPKPLQPCEPQPTALDQWNLTAAPGMFDLADLDGDGDLDLFAALPTAGIELAFNDGAGGFTGGTLVDIGPEQGGPHAAAGDLDGDGDVDLAVARPDGDDLILLFGQDGKFTPGPLLPVGAPPRAVTLADLDLDGKIDLMTLGDDFGGHSVWLGDGLGGFTAKPVTSKLVSDGTTVVDVNLDAIPDLLTIPAPKIEMSLSLGKVDVEWLPARTFNLDSWGVQGLAADLGGEKNFPDLVALRSVDDAGFVLVWEGLFLDVWSEVPATFTTSVPLAGGRLADVTADGVLDLVSATGTARVAVLVGNGGPGFLCEQVHDVAADTARSVLATGDVDGDGRVDIVAGVLDGTAVTVIRGQ